MNCRKVSRWLSAYIEGDLLPGQVFRMDEHLRNCAQCNEKLVDMRLIIQTSGELEKQQPGPYFVNRLLCAIGAKKRPFEILMGWQAKIALSGVSFVAAAIVTFLTLGPQLANLPIADNQVGNTTEMAASSGVQSQDNFISVKGFPVPDEALKRDMAMIESSKTDSLKSDSVILSNRFIQQVGQQK
jgi:predicted anti-sigma-YlaC factor YlaD